MSYQNESEKYYSEKDYSREVENLSHEGLVFDGNSTEQKNSDDTENIITETEKKSVLALKIAIGRFQGCVKKTLNVTGDYGLTRNIVKEALKNALNGREKTEPNKTGGTVKTTAATARTDSQKSVSVVTQKTQPVLLPEQSDNSPEEKFLSMSLIDSSANLLHDAMKTLLKEETENPDRRNPLDSHRVTAAVKAAQQIANLMRVKVDAHRVMRGVK